MLKKKNRGTAIKLIVKSNNLVEARYMMNIWETRLFLTVLSMIAEEDKKDKVYRIWYSEVKRNFGIKSNRCYQNLRIASITLTNKPVCLDWRTDDNFQRETHTHLFHAADILKEGQETKANVERQQYADFQLGANIKPHLVEIKKRILSQEIITKEALKEIGISGYTSYDMRNVKDLNAYGVRLYELMKKYEKTGYWVTTVEELKVRFEIENEYKDFWLFFTKVVKESVKKINKYTDIDVYDVKKIKQGRKVKNLEFYFKSKSEEEVLKLRDEPKQGPLFEIEDAEVITEPIQKQAQADLYGEFESVVVKGFGVTPSVFSNMLAKGNYTKENIEQAIAVTRRAKYKQEIKKNVAGFFIKGLQQGFTDEGIEKQRKALARSEKEKRVKVLKAEYAEKQMNRIKQLVESEDGVNEKTLGYLRKQQNKLLISRLDALKLTFDSVTIQDFRQDKILRGFFMDGIVHEHADYFLDLNIEYQKKMSILGEI